MIPAPHSPPEGKPFTGLILAGIRPTGDPLARATGVSHKALVPVVGRAMLSHVIDALRRSRSVGRIIVCGLGEAYRENGSLGELLQAQSVTLIDGRSTPSASVNEVLERTPDCVPLLITTADHPLLTPGIVDEFCERSCQRGADVTAALVPADLVRRNFPDSNRTYLRFRERAYSGCNLFALLTPAGRSVPAFWMRIEEHRKRPWRMISLLGPDVLVRFVFGRLSLTSIEKFASRKMGVKVATIVLSQPEAGYDVDTVDHLKVAEAVLRSQR
jgi:GTP:adenosylcobinamide-phosphate guanylyltransferase